jgi:hypothetical protein
LKSNPANLFTQTKVGKSTTATGVFIAGKIFFTNTPILSDRTEHFIHITADIPQ